VSQRGTLANVSGPAIALSPAMRRLDASAWSSAWRFIHRDLWTLDLSRYRGLARLGLGALRLVIVIVCASRDRLLNLEAMGLVYTTLLSLVPFLAVTFSVLKAFGAQYRIEPVLAQMLAPLGPQGAEITGHVIAFVSNMHVGVLGAFGIAGLFYSVVSLIEKIEDALNRIWRVRRSRSMVRKFSDYLSILLVGPVLVFTAFGVIASAENQRLVQRLLLFTSLQWATVAFARHALPFTFLAAAFTFLYRCLPYTRVSLRAAAVGGMTAAVLWHLAGVAFTALVAGSASYTAIYSSFAVFVLSLLWLHVAWLVVLVGGQVAYVHQHFRSYVIVHGPQATAFRERVGLAALVAIARRHVRGQPPYPLDELSRAIEVPLVTLDEVLDDFVEAGVVARAVEPEALVLTRSPDTIGVIEVLDTLHRVSHVDPVPRGEAGVLVEHVLERRDRAVRDALASVTLHTIANESPELEASVAELSRYRAGSRAAAAS
jgi:membrane protein